jgi:NADH:ubiquinone oxidoreductase subunit 2 (subunit N)
LLAFEKNYLLITFTGLFCSILSAFYYLRILKIIFFEYDSINIKEILTQEQFENIYSNNLYLDGIFHGSF